MKFYSDVFGWKINKWNVPQEYRLIDTGDGQTGINGGLMRNAAPFSGAVNTVEVASVDEFTTKIESNVGSILTPRIAIPGVGDLASCKDTEKNTFGIMQNDPNAG